MQKMFKSYYVVWKRGRTVFIFTNEKKFKSYYVVWKLQIGEKFARILSWFKSYYVVWKQLCCERKITQTQSLNRTM